MMAKDFWQQVSDSHHVEAEVLFSLVSASPHESTPVLATCWQRLSPRRLKGISAVLKAARCGSLHP